MPDNQDAIRLITIHKSKGLEFDALIIPFCNWPLCKSGKTLWCRPAAEPFNIIKLLPLKFEQALRNTIFVKEYLHEKMLSYIDNLNLLYVAFTRARKTLFISTPQQVREGFADVKDLLHGVFQQPLSPTLSPEKNEKSTDICLNDYWHPENLCFELGALTAKEPKKKTTDADHFQFSIFNFQFSIPHIARNGIYLISNETRGAQIDKGLLLHEIFRTIVTTADLEHCLALMITEGKLSETERTHIIDMVHQALDNPIVSRWFAPDIQVKTEAEILLPDGSIERPDRIVYDNGQVQVIDYKFGELESEKYRHQLLRYIDYLRRMGYSSVKGFLWYVTLNKIVEITPHSS
jgi:ATP-dependent exoDNAse (exonuclease V) beta subunit